MGGKRPNALRQYHLLITRSHEGFHWEIRYGRNAKPVRWSDGTYPSQPEAHAAGERALARFGREHEPAADAGS